MADKRYEVGQVLNIGYYGGFKNKTLIKTRAEITKIEDRQIHIKVYLSNGGYRNMFGYVSELQMLENNYQIAEC